MQSALIQDQCVHDCLNENKSASEYRSLAARLNYLALDRADLQYASKVCAQGMSNPTSDHWAKLKRVGRYLVNNGCLEQWFFWQKWDHVVTAEGDSDLDKKSSHPEKYIGRMRVFGIAPHILVGQGPNSSSIEFSGS